MMKKDFWLATHGRIEIKKDIILFNPIQQDPVNTAFLPVPAGVVKSNVFFENGTISFKVKLSDNKASCAVILNDGGSNPIYVGLNLNAIPYSIATVQINLFKNISNSGMGTSLEADRWYDIKVKVNGSNIVLSVDEVEVVNTELFVENRQLSIYFSSFSQVEIKRDIEIVSNKPTAFVIMEFSEEFDNLFSEVIKPACEEFNLNCLRGDDIYSNGLIIDDITKSLQEAYIIIADITPNNPNVFYEVGYAHGIGKPVILLCNKKRDKLPFDVSGMRTVYYDNSIKGKSIVEERLKKHLDNISNYKYIPLSNAILNRI